MELLNLISRINEETKTLPYKDIKDLYSLCVKIACGYLAKVHIDKFSSQNKWNDTIDDVASDCIVPLFVRNENDTLQIIHSYNNWNSKILTENDARFFISRLVWNRVEQRMAKVLKERDPIFNKIHKTLQNCVDGIDFKKLTFFGRVYFVRGSTEEIFSPVIDYEDFNNLPVNIFYKRRKSLLDELLNYLSQNTIYYPAIPVNMLVNRIKTIFACENNNLPDMHPQYELEIDLNTVIKNCLDNVERNLNLKYFITNKLNKNECDIINKVFYQISLDIRNGGMKGGLFSYMKSVDNGIENDLFYKKYHGIVNYLFKSFKMEIEEFIKYE